MADIFLNIFNMSVAASWLVLAVLVLRVFMKKAPKWTVVLLWGIVALRLVFPFSIESTLSLIPSAQTIPETVLEQSTFTVQTGIAPIDTGVNGYIAEQYLDSSAQPNPTAGFDFMSTAAVIWAIGIAVLLCYTVLSYLRLRSKMSTAVLMRENIYQSENVGSPFVLGIFSPKIYLPFGLDEQTANHVIAHENAHISRKDHWWKPLGFLLLSIYWFNPIIWLAYILLCKDIELACDEKVIASLGESGRADYSEALLSCSVSRRAIAACPIAFGEVGVKERVKSVLNYKKPAFWVIAAAVLICVAVSVCFLTNPKEYISSGSLSEDFEHRMYFLANDIRDFLKGREHTPTDYYRVYYVEGIGTGIKNEKGEIVVEPGESGEVGIGADEFTFIAWKDENGNPLNAPKYEVYVADYGFIPDGPFDYVQVTSMGGERLAYEIYKDGGKYLYVLENGEFKVTFIEESEVPYPTAVNFEPFTENGKMGLKNVKGEVVVEPKYSSIASCGTYFVLTLNGKTDFYSVAGNFAPNGPFDNYDFVQTEDGTPVFYAYKNGKQYLYTLKNGEFVIAENYSSLADKLSVKYGVDELEPNAYSVYNTENNKAVAENIIRFAESNFYDPIIMLNNSTALIGYKYIYSEGETAAKPIDLPFDYIFHAAVSPDKSKIAYYAKQGNDIVISVYDLYNGEIQNIKILAPVNYAELTEVSLYLDWGNNENLYFDSPRNSKPYIEKYNFIAQTFSDVAAGAKHPFVSDDNALISWIEHDVYTGAGKKEPKTVIKTALKTEKFEGYSAIVYDNKAIYRVDYINSQIYKLNYSNLEVLLSKKVDGRIFGSGMKNGALAYTVISENGEFISETFELSAEPNAVVGSVSVFEEGNKYGLKDEANKIIVPAKYVKAESFSDHIKLTNFDGTYNAPSFNDQKDEFSMKEKMKPAVEVYLLNGDKVPGGPYESVEVIDTDDGEFWIKATKDGNAYEFDYIGGEFTQTWFEEKSDALWDILDGKYTVFGVFHSNFMFKGLKDSNGKEIIPCITSGIDAPFEDRAVATQGAPQGPSCVRSFIYELPSGKLLDSSFNTVAYSQFVEGYIGIGNCYGDMSDYPPHMKDGSLRPAGAWFIDKNGNTLSKQYEYISASVGDTWYDGRFDSLSDKVYCVNFDGSVEEYTVREIIQNGGTPPTENPA